MKSQSIVWQCSDMQIRAGVMESRKLSDSDGGVERRSVPIDFHAGQ